MAFCCLGWQMLRIPQWKDVNSVVRTVQERLERRAGQRPLEMACSEEPQEGGVWMGLGPVRP